MKRVKGKLTCLFFEPRKKDWGFSNFTKVSFFRLLLYVLLTALLFFFLKGARYLLLIILSAAIHEAGHIVSALILSVPLVKIKGTFFGVRLKYDFSENSYPVQIAVSCAGAAFNVIAASLTLYFCDNAGTYFIFFAFSNLALAIFNLMPVSGFDGLGILRCFLLLLVKDAFLADKVCKRIAALFSFAFFLLTVYIQMRVGASPVLLLLSIFLLYRCFTDLSE